MNTNTSPSPDKSLLPFIMIPSYHPDEKLLTMIHDLNEAGFHDILLIDDGSKEDTQTYFQQAEAIEGVVVLHHAVNQGKGRALKTGFNYLLQHHPGRGVISCDGDGQHPVPSIQDVAEAMASHPDTLVLGVRQFAKGKNVPLSNLLGNSITIGVFFLLTGLRFGDTQCGLRGFPDSIMHKFITVPGERFDFENLMLIDVRKDQVNYAEVPMEAVYIDENETSHFNKVWDSVKIYRSILAFAAFPAFAGILSFLFAYIYISNASLCNLLQPAMIYSAGLLIGWLLLTAPMKDNRLGGGLAVIGSVLLCTILFYFLYITTGNFVGAWWLVAVVAAPLNYTIYLNQRYGKKPRRTRL